MAHLGRAKRNYWDGALNQHWTFQPWKNAIGSLADISALLDALLRLKLFGTGEGRTLHPDLFLQPKRKPGGWRIDNCVFARGARGKKIGIETASDTGAKLNTDVRRFAPAIALAQSDQCGKCLPCFML